MNPQPSPKLINLHTWVQLRGLARGRLETPPLSIQQPGAASALLRLPEIEILEMEILEIGNLAVES